MATYAIGDVQGCFEELERLLGEIRFSSDDRLWFVGDLVNRGPRSLEVLRFVRALGERAVVVLGNHDLHLVAQHAGIERARELGDEVARVLAGPQYRDFLQNMYGARPDRWDERLAGWDRLRIIVNAMTRMRFCDRGGRIEVGG